MTNFKFECKEHGIQNVSQITYKLLPEPDIGMIGPPSHHISKYTYVDMRKNLTLECGCIYEKDDTEWCILGTNDMYDEKFILSMCYSYDDHLEEYARIMKIDDMKVDDIRAELINHQNWLRGKSNRVPTYLALRCKKTQ